MDRNCSICGLIIEGDAKICIGCGEPFCLMCAGNEHYCGCCESIDFDDPRYSGYSIDEDI